MEHKGHVRQSGRTTRQIERAPLGALYVWPTSDFSVPKGIAQRLGREDLVFVSAYVLRDCPDNLAGKKFGGVVVDHYLAERDSGAAFWVGVDWVESRCIT